MENNVWKTLFTSDFSEANYLYHYTNIDKAIKIISSNSLRFSKIDKTNDTSESKPKIRFEQPSFKSDIEQSEFEQKVEKITDFFYQKNPLIRLLCFSMDKQYDESEINAICEASKLSEKDKYYNVLGRGFALPRMWAQYASNNEGICFIVDRNRLLSQVNRQIAYHTHGNVVYKQFFDNYTIKPDAIDSLYEKIESNTNNNLTIASLFSNDSDFVKFCYFEKLYDWSSENEFRIVALTDTENELYISKFDSYLKGVVLGENIDPDYERLIRFLLSDKKCDIRKISFDSNICRLI